MGHLALGIRHKVLYPQHCVTDVGSWSDELSVWALGCWILNVDPSGLGLEVVDFWEPSLLC